MGARPYVETEFDIEEKINTGNLLQVDENLVKDIRNENHLVTLTRVLPRGLLCDRGYLFIRLFPGTGLEPHMLKVVVCTPFTMKNFP